MPEDVLVSDTGEQDALSVDEAIGIAKRWLSTALADENITNLGLEEFHHDARQGVWSIALGFSRPWNTVRNALTVIAGEAAVKRSVKVLTVSDRTRTVTSMSDHKE